MDGKGAGGTPGTANESMMNRLTLALFDEIDRLGDVEASDGDVMRAEAERARAMVDLAGSVVDNANVMLKVARMRAEMLSTSKVSIPRMLDA